MNTITDEESTGAGGIACVAHGVRADAGIVPEPTAFDVWVACRGSVYPTITVEGRPGPRRAAAAALARRRRRQRDREGADRARRDPRAARGVAHARRPAAPLPLAARDRADLMRAGEWSVTYPASCAITCAVLFPPAFADADGYGSRVADEVRDAIGRACAADPWLAEHPPTFTWTADVPPMEIPPGRPDRADRAGRERRCRRAGRLGGLDSWFDGATYTLAAGTPSVAFGPRSIAGRTPSTSTCPSTISCAARRRSRSRRCASAGRHEHAHHPRRAAWPGHAGPRSHLDARGSADRARAPPGGRSREHVKGLRRPPTRIVASPFLRAQQTAAPSPGTRPPDRDRSAPGRVRLDPALALDARRGRRADAVRRHLASRRRGLRRRDDRRLLRAGRRSAEGTPARTRSPCSSATAARRSASSAGR